MDISRSEPTAHRLTVSVAEAAAILGIGKSAAYEAVHSGDIPSIRVGRRWLVPRAALDQMLAVTPQKAEAV